MHTNPFIRFIRRFWIIWIVAIVIILVLYVGLASPLSPLHYCTLIGCSDMLELTLTHEPPGEYTLLVTSSSGETRSVTCVHGESAPISLPEATCRTGIVTIYGFAPTEVTVKITWQGGSHSTTGKPAYTALHPNGLFCPPTCQLGKLRLVLP